MPWLYLFTSHHWLIHTYKTWFLSYKLLSSNCTRSFRYFCCSNLKSQNKWHKIRRCGFQLCLLLWALSLLFSDVINLCFLTIKSGFLVMWFEEQSILTEVIIMLDDYFKRNLGVKDLPRLEIEPQSPSPQPVVIVMSYNGPQFLISSY